MAKKLKNKSTCTTCGKLTSHAQLLLCDGEGPCEERTCFSCARVTETPQEEYFCPKCSSTDAALASGLAQPDGAGGTTELTVGNPSATAGLGSGDATAKATPPEHRPPQ